MKILKPVNGDTVPGYRQSDYSPILRRLSTLEPGLALPVECEDKKKAMNLQYWVFRVLNPQMMYGSKWSAVRRKNTIFISRAEHIANEKKTA